MSDSPEYDCVGEYNGIRLMLTPEQISRWGGKVVAFEIIDGRKESYAIDAASSIVKAHELGKGKQIVARALHPEHSQLEPSQDEGTDGVAEVPKKARLRKLAGRQTA